MEECRLCNISRELLIYETEYCRVLANFLQVECVSAVMVVPKRHIETVLELSQEEYVDLFVTAREVHRKLVAETGETEFNYLLNEGTQISGKTEKHVHLHVFSRKLDDGIVNMSRPNRRKYLDEEVKTLKQILIEWKSLRFIFRGLFVYIKF